MGLARLIGNATTLVSALTGGAVLTGSRVGLLPSNARLGPEHSVRLARLLEYVSEALS